MARGDITRSAGLGKRLDTLPYEVVQVEGQAPVRVEIELFMSKKFDHSEGTPKPVSGATFHLRCGEEGVDGPDIDANIRAMRSRLDKRHEIKWESWIKVRVEKSRLYMSDNGTGMELMWDRVYRGVSYDGAVLMREYARHHEKTWRILPWPDYFKDQRGRTLACIPETAENIKSLETFRDKLDAMRVTLADFVSPDNIEATLSMISSGGMNLISQPA